MAQLRCWRDRRGRHHYEWRDDLGEVHAWEVAGPEEREVIEQRLASLAAPGVEKRSKVSVEVSDASAKPIKPGISGVEKMSKVSGKVSEAVEPRPVAVPEIVGLMTQGIPGGGAERSLAASLSTFGPRAGILVTGDPRVLAGSVPHDFPVLPPDQLERLRVAKVVVDDGAMILGRGLRYEGPFVQAVRNSHNRVTEGVREPHPHRIYTALSLAERYREALRPEDTIIPNGVPVPEECPAGPREEAEVILVGRLVPRKGIAEMLDGGIRPPVAVVGDGPLRAALEQHHPEADFQGYLPESDRAFAGAGIAACYTEYAEGFWRVPWEALAAGCATIANAAGDLRYYLPTRGPVVEVESAEEVARRVEELRADPDEIRRRGRAGWELARAVADERVMALRWRWALQRVMGEAPDAPPAAIGLPYGGTGREAHLDRCLAAITHQTLPARVYLLYDVPNGAGGLPAIAAKYPQVTVVPVEYDNRRGANRSAVRNALLEQAAGDEILVWLDSDCVVAQDFVERVVAMLTVDPAAFIAFPRRRVELPEALPEVMLEPALDAALPAVTGPRRTLDKSLRHLAGLAGRTDPEALIHRILGPAQAAPAGRAQRWDDRLTGWGGEEIDWGLTRLATSSRVMFGPMIYHLEHEVDEAARAETDRRNMRYVREKHGLSA